MWRPMYIYDYISLNTSYNEKRFRQKRFFLHKDF
jgi:transglutaminase/protease-like cytokinesis protein 3